MNADEYDAGLGTTPGMWELLSDELTGALLPDALNEAIYALCNGKAQVVLKQGEPV